MLKVVIILIVAATFILVVNLLICKWIIYKSKRQFISPFIEKKGWMLQSVRHAGFFNTGDFKSEFSFGVGGGMGSVVNHTYAFVTTNNSNGETIRFTAKIVTVFFFIKSVEYKGLV